MRESFFSRLSLFKKVIFIIGWFSVLNIFFWIILIFIYNYKQSDKFWNDDSYKVVYIFGWINLLIFLVAFLIGIFLGATETFK